MSERTAVVLFNLGGPDSLDSVRPFLFNLFADPDIFKFPLGFVTQKLFAYMISRRRAPEARKGYAAIGGKSPLLENTRAQAIALQLALTEEGAYDVYVCMRYWHPLTKEVVAELKQKSYAQLVLLPLYPQYSATTSGSSYNEFMRQCKRQHYRPETVYIEHWYESDTYQRAIVEAIQSEAEKLPDPDPSNIELLFSAHGLPQKIVDSGDPYAQHIVATYEAIADALDWPNTSLCFQSRVGPLAWLKPYTEDVIKTKAQAGTEQILVYPIAFVSDHVETLYELGIQYSELAKQQGVTHYRVVPALNDNPLLIEALKECVLGALND
jgi:ferrochelatase